MREKDPTAPPTHMGWAQFRYQGKFVRWYQVGPAREYKDAQGRTRFCSWDQAGPRAHTGIVWWLPIGEQPPDEEEPE